MAPNIVKRSGQIVPFRPKRILHSLEAALREARGISDDKPLPTEMHRLLSAVGNEVIRKALLQAENGPSLTAETIQDLVELELLQNGNYEIARAYITYRNKSKEIPPGSPRALRVLRRDGRSFSRLSPMKIASAIERGFRATYHIEGPTPQALVESVNLVTSKVVSRIGGLARQGQTLHVPLIQDEIERIIMGEGFHQVARNYIVYRARKASQFDESGLGDRLPDARSVGAAAHISRKQIVIEAVLPGRTFKAVDYQGRIVLLSEQELRARLETAAQGLRDVAVDEVLEEALKNVGEETEIEQIHNLLIAAAVARTSVTPVYAALAARILVDMIYGLTLGMKLGDPALEQSHARYFVDLIHMAVKAGLLGDAFLTYDLVQVSGAFKLERDLKFTYEGLRTLYDRCLLRRDGRVIEPPQIYWMRVAMDLAMDEGRQKTERALQFYEVLSKLLIAENRW